MAARRRVEAGPGGGRPWKPPSTPSQRPSSPASTVIPGVGRLVDHVEGDHDGDAGLDDLQDEVQAALEGAGVDDDDDGVGKVAAAAEDLVDRHLLVERVGAQAVGPGQVDDLGARAVRQLDLPRGAG